MTKNLKKSSLHLSNEYYLTVRTKIFSAMLFQNLCYVIRLHFQKSKNSVSLTPSKVVVETMRSFSLSMLSLGGCVLANASLVKGKQRNVTQYVCLNFSYISTKHDHTAV